VESPTLSNDERQQVIRLTVATANKRCLVLAGTGSNATDTRVADTKNAEKLGIGGRVLVARTTYKPRRDSCRISKHRGRHNRCPSPHNILDPAVVDINPETVVRLAKECPTLYPIHQRRAEAWSVSAICAAVCPKAFTI